MITHQLIFCLGRVPTNDIRDLDDSRNVHYGIMTVNGTFINFFVNFYAVLPRVMILEIHILSLNYWFCIRWK